MTICIIAALSENRVIGRQGDLPWHLPADLRRFRRLTIGHPLVIGRKTFDSIGRPLPGRTMIVITRNENWRMEGIETTRGLDEALERAAGPADVFIAGGGEIYELALHRADRMYLTVVHASIDGDALFPEFDDDDWRLVEDERHAADDDHAFAYSFRVYDRVRASRPISPAPSES